MHQVDDPFRDGKSQPVALFIGIRVPAVKFFKDPFHRGVIHADAGIADGDTHLISCDNEFGRKHTASRGEFDGILQEIDPDLLQHLTVAVKFARRQINVEIQMMETKTALDKYGVVPDIIIGCAGGGSNLGGLISPFMGEKLRGEKDYRFIAVEPASCPSFTRGKFAYDFCDTGMVCPLAKMYTLGSNFIPSPSHAGGLRYHGMSSILSQLYHDGYMEAVSVEQTKVFEAAEQFARIEGILPAPESSHAIRVAIDEAMKCKETGEAKTIVFGLTGTGYFDMVAYEKFHNGQMTDYIPTDEELAASFATLPKVPGQEG